MGLINPKPRFAYDDATDQVYDYVKQRDIALTDHYEAADGIWDLLEVKRLILAGQAVEEARIADLPRRPLPTAPPPPVEQPGTQAAPSTESKGTLELEEPAKEEAEGQGKTLPGLSVAQLIALNLSPIQAAALGLTSAQLSATGVTAAQIANWGMNEERAEALKLTPAQRAILLPEPAP